MIAYGSGKAGQWAKSQADRRFRRILDWTVFVSLVGGGLAGFALGITALPFIYRYIPRARRVPAAAYDLAVICAEVGAAVGVWLLMRAASKPIDQLARERVGVLAGGQAEALVAYQLRTLSDEWHLFNNVTPGAGGDADHVLVGPGGFFCISTKSHRGFYAWDAAAKTALLNGKPTDHVREAQNVAMQLRHWLEARLKPEHSVKNIPFVYPVLCVPLAAVQIPSEVTRVQVVDDRQLVGLAEKGMEKLTGARIRGCVEVVKELTRSDAVAPKS